MKTILKTIALSLLISLAINNSSMAEKIELTEEGFAKYVVKLKAEALAKGFNQALIDESFSKVKFHKRAVKADRSQPENVETLDTYLPKRVPKWKVEKARVLYKEHKVLLEQVGEKYQVQPRFIVALWGLETNFGKFTGGSRITAMNGIST